MTKEMILKYFEEINVAYNDCTRYDSLSEMLDKLTEELINKICRILDDLEREDIETYGCKIPEGFDAERAKEAIKKKLMED